MTRTPDQLINAYLARLDRELDDLPRARRREVVEEISEHIEQAREEGDGNDEVSTRNLLDRLGDPADIAAEAHARLGVDTPKPGALEVTALVLLLVGGFLFGVGWLVGLVLLWSSPVWSTSEKLLGTFIVPGGLATPLFFFLVGAVGGSNQVCTGPVGAGTETVCTGGTSTASQFAWTFLFFLLVIGNIAVIVYLARRMRGRSALAVAA
jgi:hypothetical protein